MRYIDNPELFSVVEMLANEDAAHDAAYAYAAADVYSAYANAVEVDVPRVERWLVKYFKISGENKQDYTNEVERLK